MKEAEKEFNRFVHKNLEYIYTPGWFDYSNWIDERRGAVEGEYKRLLAEREKKSEEEIQQLSKESKIRGWVAKGFSRLAQGTHDWRLYDKAVRTIQDKDAEALFISAKEVL